TRDGHLLAVCTQLATRAPAVFLLDAGSGATLDTLQVTPGQLFGGVYPYLDHRDRLHIVDGDHDLLRVAVQTGDAGGPRLIVEDRIPLAGAIAADCGSPPCDGVVGLAPDHDGRVWFATDLGTVGTVDPDTGRVETLALPGGERVGNSLATAREGAAVVTDHALYLLRADAAGAPVIVFRAAYDRGPARKPGQLTHGSGATPTFFGPESGSEYLAITDNARPVMNLLVFRADASAELVCEEPIPAPAGLGSENSPIGAGQSVIVASTYGYPYPALPTGAPPSDPGTAPLLGGIARLDVVEGGRGCELAWTLELRSAAVPKLSLADRLVYTVERTAAPSDGGAPAADGYALAVIDPEAGEVRARHPLPGIADTLQLAGTVAPGRVFLQGTLTGLVRVAAAP
ncbi:MAG: hypothetical protein FJ104_10050, partial [Deltaproteobacteria bacterium]|nr:hypothetical protein [Deltaproteobacteria bacterium]